MRGKQKKGWNSCKAQLKKLWIFNNNSHNELKTINTSVYVGKKFIKILINNFSSYNKPCKIAATSKHHAELKIF